MAEIVIDENKPWLAGALKHAFKEAKTEAGRKKLEAHNNASLYATELKGNLIGSVSESTKPEVK